MSAVLIEDSGAWTGTAGLPHVCDDGLAAALAEMLAGWSVLDLGCGDGFYVRALRSHGIESEGYDGNPDTVALSDGLCCVADLTFPCGFGQWDAVLCLEVGEHIPARHESMLFDNLAKHARDTIIVSWAAPGQAGCGHVNCRPANYVLEKLAKRGFGLDWETTRKLRTAATVSWLRCNLLAVRKGRPFLFLPTISNQKSEIRNPPFDACFYINLDTNEARRETFCRRVKEADWPFPTPERWPGVVEPAPDWWRTGKGAWGCFLAHFRLYHYCLEAGIRAPVIFEDDAVFCEDFGERVKTFMAAVPNDWQQVYFGGNHTTLPPTVVNAEVLRGRGVSATHAYALRGAGLSAIHEMVGRFPVAIEDENAHIDAMWNMLHQAGQIKTYTPWRWLVGQAAGGSDRCGYVWEADEWFQLSDEALRKAEENYYAQER